MTDKETALKLLEEMPDSASMDDIAYFFYVRSRVDRGLRQAEAGETVSHEEVMKSVAKWLKQDGP